ncbi:S10 family serine carboxypeptidase-like protein [Streptomyces shenzhenensis]|uniref:S10 family serine carboxypeptidase-like protein n=1 Tax=Streptomyces shenzhenensis TaxID=943815 RepID=UPI003D8A9B67
MSSTVHRPEHGGATALLLVDTGAIPYRAAVEDVEISNGAGEPGARYVYTEYVRTDLTEDERARRPVVFAFNGGPGSASLWLHLGIGPRRIADADTLSPRQTPPFGLVDNDDSPLDVADLVFIDPPGTGFSRLLGKEHAPAFYGTEQDARATIEFIERWVRRNARENSPRFLVGESYGTLRAARVARNAGGGPFLGGATRAAHLSGAIVLGPAFALGDDSWAGEVRDALQLTSLAATARHHKIAREQATDDEVLEFAREELLPVLTAGSMASPQRRQAAAARIAGLLGLDAQVVLGHDLRISPNLYTRLALASSECVLGSYDSRYILPAAGAGDDPVSDDPAMGQYAPGFLGSIECYLRRDLAYVTTEDYRAIAWAEVYSDWDYGGPERRRSIDEFAEVLRRNPRFELLVGVGSYDLVTTSAAAAYAVSRHTVDGDRIHLRNYESGHMPYLGAAPRARLAQDIRSFITRLSA